MAKTVQFNDREWKDMIKKINSKIKDPRPLLKTAFNVRGFKDVINHFQNEEGPKGKWKKSQRAIREGGQTLQDTGNLKGGFLPGNIENKGRNAILFFNNATNENDDFYGVFHNEGIGNPKREFMWLSDDAQEDMLKIILDGII